MSNGKKRRGISKTALGDQHGFFQHFQTNTTDYATRDRYLALRGGEASLGRDTESLYGVSAEGEDSRVPTEYVAPHLSTRYSPDRVGVQAMRVSDGVYQDPYTNKVYDYNEGFKTEDGRSFPGGSASLQSSLMRVANTLDHVGLIKEASKIDAVIRKVANRRLRWRYLDQKGLALEATDGKNIYVWKVSEKDPEAKKQQKALIGEEPDWKGLTEDPTFVPGHKDWDTYMSEGSAKKSSLGSNSFRKVSNATGGNATGGSATISGGNQTLNQTFNLNEFTSPGSGEGGEAAPGTDEGSLGAEGPASEFEFEPVENPCVDFELPDIFKALFEAHEDPESPYKLSSERVSDLGPCTLTSDEKRIVTEAGLPEGMHLKSSGLMDKEGILKALTVTANRLDALGFSDEASEVDSVAEAVEEQATAESEAQAWDKESPAWDQISENDIRSIASKLDYNGHHEVADILDSWMKKSAK